MKVPKLAFGSCVLKVGVIVLFTAAGRAQVAVFYSNREDKNRLEKEHIMLQRDIFAKAFRMSTKRDNTGYSLHHRHNVMNPSAIACSLCSYICISNG